MSKRKKRNQQHFVPYVRGFKPPTLATKRSALGPVEDEVFYSFTGHQSIPKCASEDDWLAQYDEEGRSVAQFKLENPWFSKRKLKYMKQSFVSNGCTILEKYPSGKLFLLPIGDLNLNLTKLANFARTYLGVPFSVLPTLETGVDGGKVWVERGDQKRYVQARVAENGRFQINVTAALQEVRYHLEKNSSNSLCVIALTKYELFETRSDLFVAGMASGNQRIAVFSILRYDPNLTFSSEFWHDVRKVAKPLSKIKTERLIFERSAKLLVHETMHLLGLDHCIYFDCVMNGSGHLEEDFRQPMSLCPICLRKIKLLTGCDIVKRYEKLVEFYREFDMKKEVDWVTKRLNSF